MARVELTGLSKVFGGKVVLQPTDLAIEAGEFMVIVGASGCGKSTLLRLIAGLEKPDGGRILIGGRDVTWIAPAERDLAMVFQSYALYPHLTVAENIAFPLRAAGRPKAEIVARVTSVAETLGLSSLLDRKPRALSGGQRQRVSIGRAIVRDPRVLLLDEPLSNLDATLRARMRHEFARLHQRLGATMIYVTHDQLEAMTLANRIVVMAKGRVEQIGSPMDLYERPANVTVAETIGSPAMNFLPVIVSGATDGKAHLRLNNGGSLQIVADVPQTAVGEPATLGVRPEHLVIDPEGPFVGTIELFERVGPLSFAHLGNGSDVPIVAQLPGDQSVEFGETMAFAIAPGRGHLFGPDGTAWSSS